MYVLLFEFVGRRSAGEMSQTLAIEEKVSYHNKSTESNFFQCITAQLYFVLHSCPTTSKHWYLTAKPSSTNGSAHIKSRALKNNINYVLNLSMMWKVYSAVIAGFHGTAANTNKPV